MPLTPEQIEQYRRDGFLVFPELFTSDDVQALLHRLNEYVEEKRPVPSGVAFQVEPSLKREDASPAARRDAFRKVENLAL
ncbi:MAG: phytanoyl-CoA dioxygenase family protein, partial [Armatimonadetes bacterium]|nr:phytanoyl-CoA dioxygenase family protein [Armatimonadota bacterium]